MSLDGGTGEHDTEPVSEYAEAARQRAEAASEIPPWMLAYSALEERGLATGLQVSKAWLHRAMGIPLYPVRDLDEEDEDYAKRVRFWDLRVVHPQLVLLKRALMDRHGLWLRAVGTTVDHGALWELRNADAAPVVARQATRDVHKTLSTANRVLAGMSADGLSEEQREAHSAALRKIVHMRTLLKQRSRVGW